MASFRSLSFLMCNIVFLYIYPHHFLLHFAFWFKFYSLGLQVSVISTYLNLTLTSAQWDLCFHCLNVVVKSIIVFDLIISLCFSGGYLPLGRANVRVEGLCFEEARYHCWWVLAGNIRSYFKNVSNIFNLIPISVEEKKRGSCSIFKSVKLNLNVWFGAYNHLFA